MKDKLLKSEPCIATENKLRAVIAEQETLLHELTDIVAHVRHGINNPLTGILGQAQLLLRGDLPPNVRQQIESIENLALRIRDTAALLRSIQRPPPTPHLTNWAENNLPHKN